MRRLLSLVLVLGACTPKFDLTPNRSDTTQGTASFKLLAKALLAIDGNEMSTTLTGSLDVSVAPGAFVADTIVVSATHRGLEMERQALGETHTLSTSGDIPDTLQAAFAHEGAPRLTTVSVDGSITLTAEHDTPLGSDVDVLMDPVIWAPAALRSVIRGDGPRENPRKMAFSGTAATP